ncbi:hypothetical protein ACU4GG_41590 [Streptomyces nojiriensis]
MSGYADPHADTVTKYPPQPISPSFIIVRLGYVAPVASAEVDYGRAHGGVTTVPLYGARDIALLDVTRPSVDWRAVRDPAGPPFPGRVAARP